LNFAVAIANCLLQLGFRPLVLDSEGRGGIHIWIIFDRPIQSELAYYGLKDDSPAEAARARSESSALMHALVGGRW
jgi:hypothetical protein